MFQTLKKLLPGSQPALKDPALVLKYQSPDWAFTHDQWVLEQFIQQLLFIPKGMEDLIQDIPEEDEVFVKEITDSCYTDANFLAYKWDVGEHRQYSLVMPGDFKPSGFFGNGTVPPPAKVRGSLHLVWANKMFYLDNAHMNGVRYVRQRIRVIYPWRFVKYGSKHPIPEIGSHGFKIITAWIYVGVPTYWDDRIGGVFAQPLHLYVHEGKPRPWIGEFYDFK